MFHVKHRGNVGVVSAPGKTGDLANYGTPPVPARPTEASVGRNFGQADLPYAEFISLMFNSAATLTIVNLIVVICSLDSSKMKKNVECSVTAMSGEAKGHPSSIPKRLRRTGK